MAGVGEREESVNWGCGVEEGRGESWRSRIFHDASKLVAVHSSQGVCIVLPW